MGRARIASLADGLVLGLLGLALLVDLAGGLRLGRGWYRLTITSPTRLLIAAAAIAVVRHLVIRHPSWRERLIARRQLRGANASDLPLTWPARREWAVAVAVFAAATEWLVNDQWRLLTGVLDRGDPMFSMWRLAWIAHQIAADPLHLFDANIFFPATGTLAYSDATLLPGLLVAPFVWIGVPVAVMHGVLYVASFFLAALAMFALARAVTGRLVPSLFAGVLFGFYPYRISTYSHLEMQGVFLMPLALLFLLRVLAGGRRRDAIWLGVCIALQTLWSLYLGAYLAVGLAVVVAVRWIAGHFLWRERLGPLLVSALVAGVTLIPYSLPYLSARQAVGDRERRELTSFSASPRDFFNLNEMNALYGPALMSSPEAERQLFPGSTALVAAVLALVPPVTPLAVVATFGTIVAFDAALGVNGATFSWLFEHAPIFRAFRVPARFGMLMGLFISLLAALGLSRLLTRWPGRLTHAIAIAFLAFAAFELRVALPLAPVPAGPPAVFAALPDPTRAVLVNLPIPVDDSEYWIEPTYLYYSTFHWPRLINGYSGFTPSWYPRLQVASRDLPDDDAVDAFRRQGAAFLVLHEEFCPPGRFRALASAFDARADIELISTSTSPAGEARLYRLRSK